VLQVPSPGRAAQPGSGITSGNDTMSSTTAPRRAGTCTRAGTLTVSSRTRHDRGHPSGIATLTVDDARRAFHVQKERRLTPGSLFTHRPSHEMKKAKAISPSSLTCDDGRCDQAGDLLLAVRVRMEPVLCF
jgi:hypothetical protein